MKQLLELPLNLTVVSPAHTPNWDLVSDVVNSCSRIYRSSKQCRSRYESVLIPREEGKVGRACAGEGLRGGRRAYALGHSGLGGALLWLTGLTESSVCAFPAWPLGWLVARPLGPR